MSDYTFKRTLDWIEVERESYQQKKFDYKTEPDKPIEYWTQQQFNSYVQRLELFGLDTIQGFQAALKLAATIVALCEHYGDKMDFPSPGMPSGDILTWT